jgi:hypothetical protein
VNTDAADRVNADCAVEGSLRFRCLKCRGGQLLRSRYPGNELNLIAIAEVACLAKMQTVGIPALGDPEICAQEESSSELFLPEKATRHPQPPTTSEENDAAPR